MGSSLARQVHCRVLPLAGLAMLLALVLSAVPLPALGHTFLEGTEPVSGGQLARAPGEVRLSFTEDLEPRFASVTMAIGSSEPAAATVGVEGSAVVAVVPDDLAAADSTGASRWEVAYRVVSGDGHPIDGVLMFDVAATPPRSTPGESPPSPERTTPRAVEAPAPATSTGPTSRRLSDPGVPGSAAWRWAVLVVVLTAAAATPIGWAAWRAGRPTTP